jgi:hypothetical protein
MGDASKSPDAIGVMSEQHGLGKALKLFPEGLTAAAERGLKPLGQAPNGTSSTSAPAHIFNPARFQRDE